MLYLLAVNLAPSSSNLKETFTLASREISSLLEHAQAGSGWIVDYVPMFKAYSKDNKLYDTGRMQAAAR